MQYFPSFLRVRHLGVAELSGSGSESLMRFQSRYGPGLQSSESWAGTGGSSSEITYCGPMSGDLSSFPQGSYDIKSGFPRVSDLKKRERAKPQHLL